MRNLFRYLWKIHAFLLFVFLEIIAGYLLVANNSYQRTAFVSSSNSLSNSVLSLSNNVSEYFSLRTQNDQLASENARLRSQLLSAYIITDNKIFERNDTLFRQQYKFTELKIISNSLNKLNNYIRLNKGSLQGIKPDMGLINANGVIGIVKDVSDNFCSAISVLHSKTAIDAKLKNNGYTGTVIWSGGSYRYGSLVNIPSHVKIHKGDTVITSGNSSMFPEGIMVGTVESFKLKSGESFFTIKILFSVDYNKVEHAYAILNLFKEEQKKLTEKSEHD
jgi:rod shape-determining protein MreC